MREILKIAELMLRVYDLTDTLKKVCEVVEQQAKEIEDIKNKLEELQRE